MNKLWGVLDLRHYGHLVSARVNISPSDGNRWDNLGFGSSAEQNEIRKPGSHSYTLDRFNFLYVLDRIIFI